MYVRRVCVNVQGIQNQTTNFNTNCSNPANVCSKTGQLQYPSITNHVNAFVHRKQLFTQIKQFTHICIVITNSENPMVALGYYVIVVTRQVGIADTTMTHSSYHQCIIYSTSANFGLQRFFMHLCVQCPRSLDRPSRRAGRNSRGGKHKYDLLNL